jgi:hypothetical protein
MCCVRCCRSCGLCLFADVSSSVDGLWAAECGSPHRVYDKGYRVGRSSMTMGPNGRPKLHGVIGLDSTVVRALV